MGAIDFNVEINCPSTSESLPFLDRICKQALQYLQDEEQTKVSFAIHEGLINAIQCSKESADLKFSIQKTDDILEIEIINLGPEVPRSIIEKVSSLSFEDVLWEDHGRGLLIINTVADEWSLSRDNEGRNILKIRMAGLWHG